MEDLPPVSGPLHAAALSLYRLAAKLSGVYLGGHQIAESVYVHRSVATGEVSFGRSDIDLLMVVRQPESDSADGPELASLYQRMCLLRRLHPALVSIQMHDTRGLARWFRTDTYRASLERRSAILLAGRLAQMPCVPVRREDAVRWFAFNASLFFSPAISERNPRNLRKIATEMWSAYACAEGRCPEPDVTRRQGEESARGDAAGAGLADVVDHPERAPDFVFGLAKRLHDDLLPPLRPLGAPLVFRSPMPPGLRERLFVVPPGSGCPIPTEAYQPFPFIATPELLALYCHYANPFAAWGFPRELTEAGFVQPSLRQYVRSCRFYLQDNFLRLVGFTNGGSPWLPGITVATVAHALPYLQNGETPPPMPVQQKPPESSVEEFYRRDFGRIYCQAQEQLEVLEELDRRLA